MPKFATNEGLSFAVRTAIGRRKTDRECRKYRITFQQRDNLLVGAICGYLEEQGKMREIGSYSTPEIIGETLWALENEVFEVDYRGETLHLKLTASDVALLVHNFCRQLID